MQLNGTLSLDNYVASELEALAPHKSVFNLDEPRKVSVNLSIPKPVISTIASWLHHNVDYDQSKETLMQQLYIT